MILLEHFESVVRVLIKDLVQGDQSQEPGQSTNS